MVCATTSQLGERVTSQLLVVSGSNMSGKSTLLRTVGVNAVLAFAGAPVRAGRLRLSPLRIGATLRIQDSLQEGRSRFYAEITRIREIADLAAGPSPVLFLLDELFHGTNSHDRAVGAAGRSARAARSRRDRSGHDARSRADGGRRRARRRARSNVHFDDRFEGGEIAVRLRHEAGAGDAQQRDRADARRRPRCAGVTMADTTAAVTYGSYLKIDELLSLQQPRSEGPEHDEMLFIIIHQVYELWFKELLHEFDRVARCLTGDEPHRAQHTLKRILTILKVMVAQLDILETMTPLEFLSFRARLEAASGFQSDQFRQIEFVLGAKSESAHRSFPEGSRAREALSAAITRRRCGTHFSTTCRARATPFRRRISRATSPCRAEPSPEIQQILVDVYRRDPKNAELCERLVDLDEGLQEWRYRHVKMVERTIGMKPGTGGSSGAAYLATTVGRPLFPDLWEIRAPLISQMERLWKALRPRSRTTLT